MDSVSDTQEKVHKPKKFMYKSPVVETIRSICLYYGVSKPCAYYMYHRAHRSTEKGDRYMIWPIYLQNAIVRGDKCLIKWGVIEFNNEIKQLEDYGVFIDKEEASVFRWGTEKNSKVIKPKLTDGDGWTTVSYKKKNKSRFIPNINLIKRQGLYI